MSSFDSGLAASIRTRTLRGVELKHAADDDEPLPTFEHLLVLCHVRHDLLLANFYVCHPQLSSGQACGMLPTTCIGTPSNMISMLFQS